MRNTLFLALVSGLVASTAFGTDLNVSVKATANDANLVVVGSGEPVAFYVEGILSDDLNEGLALVGFNLHFTDDPLPVDTIDVPSGAISCANPMPNFSRFNDWGITNPAGFKGTPIGADLVQVGGAQNTIRNTADNADFPIGTPFTGIAQPSVCGTAILATGTVIAPTDPGDYELQLTELFANVIVEGETLDDVFMACERAGDEVSAGSISNLIVRVGNVATVSSWASVGFHDRINGGAGGDVALELTADDLASEPRLSGVSKIVVSFDGSIDPSTATAANVTVAGCDFDGAAVDVSGIATAVATAAADTQMVITFSPKLPDFARYEISLSGILAAGGTAAAGDMDRVVTAVLGDATGDRRVRANDVGGARSFIGVDPIDPTNVFHVRSDANNDGRIRANDIGGIRSMIGNDARDIVCP